MPIQAAENYQTGLVQSVGPGKDLGNGLTIPIDLKAGDRVLYLHHTANMVKTGDDLVIIPHAEVLAVLEDRLCGAIQDIVVAEREKADTFLEPGLQGAPNRSSASAQGAGKRR